MDKLIHALETSTVSALALLLSACSADSSSDCNGPYGCIDPGAAQPDEMPEATGGQANAPAQVPVGAAGQPVGAAGQPAMPAPSADPTQMMPPPVRDPSQRAVGYLPTYRSLGSWNARIDYAKLSHLSIAFANPTSGNELTFGVPDAEVQAVVQAAHAQNVKVLASLGGAALRDATPWLGPTVVDGFVDAVDRFLDAYQLDGVDVDFEGDAVDEHYSPFVEKVSAKVKPKGKLVTAALATWFTDKITDNALAQFDFINVMAYDHCGSWTQPCEHSNMSVAQSELTYFGRTRGIAADKLVLGVPFYGHCWGTGCPASVMTFAEIAARHPDALAQDWITTADTTLSYNGEATLAAKAALSRDYGGVMIWEIGQDVIQGRSLFTALTDAL